MKRFIKLLSICFFTFTCVPAIAAMPMDLNTATATLDPNADMVKKTITAFMEKNHIPGVAVELYVDGKPYSYYFGYANREQKKPITEQTIFEIGSISKIMTSILLTEQIDIAKMSLNDSVTKYMNALPESFDSITLQSLATQTSGLPFTVPVSVKSSSDLNKYVKNLSLPMPDERWQYSNLGMGILSNAIEKVAHKDINELYLTHILAPLGMQPIALNVPTELKVFYAQGYDKEDKPVTPSKLGLFPAASGIKLSANDMQRFLSAAIGLPGTPLRIFYPMRMTQTAYIKLPDQLQGLAWQIHPVSIDNIARLLVMTDTIKGPIESEVIDKPTYTDDMLMDKAGSTSGFGSYLAVMPNQKSGIAILANKTIPSDSLVTVGREILFKSTQLTGQYEVKG